jgi:2-polyprenyl-3-methyl-5-hydroxy-6-metoxy-1,4-benzoquinol methylase
MAMTPIAVHAHAHRGEVEMSASSVDLIIKTKQQRKEEGRQRALDIAMAKQKVLSNDAVVKNSRHGARNQHRHKHFARWILHKFPHIIKDCTDIQPDELNYSDGVPAGKNARMHILDIAGGKGELSARLSMCHSLHVVMIDPRPADIESVYMKSVIPCLLFNYN